MQLNSGLDESHDGRWHCPLITDKTRGCERKLSYQFQ